jgi:SAM-dependent methyltransferase
MNDYLNVSYDENLKPYTKYPEQLVKYIFKKYDLKEKQNILEIGCGRGEFINEFYKLGMDVHAIDIYLQAKQKFPHIKIKYCDLETNILPYENNFFDCIYSKSVVEHLYNPEKIFKNVLEILKPGGKLITLTPCWKDNYKMFYEDYTHRTPFTLESLRDIHLANGFENVNVVKFIQLPILWSESFFLKKIFRILSLTSKFLLPVFLKKYSKWVRFSKETMLLSYATKKK